MSETSPSSSQNERRQASFSLEPPSAHSPTPPPRTSRAESSRRVITQEELDQREQERIDADQARIVREREAREAKAAAKLARDTDSHPASADESAEAPSSSASTRTKTQKRRDSRKKAEKKKAEESQMGPGITSTGGGTSAGGGGDGAQPQPQPPSTQPLTLEGLNAKVDKMGDRLDKSMSTIQEMLVNLGATRPSSSSTQRPTPTAGTNPPRASTSEERFRQASGGLSSLLEEDSDQGESDHEYEDHISDGSDSNEFPFLNRSQLYAPQAYGDSSLQWRPAPLYRSAKQAAQANELARSARRTRIRNQQQAASARRRSGQGQQGQPERSSQQPGQGEGHESRGDATHHEHSSSSRFNVVGKIKPHDLVEVFDDDTDPIKWWETLRARVRTQLRVNQFDQAQAAQLYAAVLAIIPNKLGGSILMRYSHLSDYQVDRLLSNLDAWKEIMVDWYLADPAEREIEAEDMVWQWEEGELCEDYCMEKKQALVRADPSLALPRNAQKLWLRVKKGIRKDSLAIHMHELKKPSPSETKILAEAREVDKLAEELRREMREKREEKKSLRAEARSRQQAAPRNSNPAATTSQSSLRSTGNDNGPFSSLEKYDPARRKTTRNSDGSSTITYQRASGKVVTLTRPCRVKVNGKPCGAQHFDFEHDALTSTATSHNAAGGPHFYFNDIDVLESLETADADYFTPDEGSSSQDEHSSASSSASRSSSRKGRRVLKPTGLEKKGAKKNKSSSRRSPASFRRGSAQPGL